MGSMSEEQRFSLLGKTLKEGERILAPTRRPDGTLRKAIRIRAGYVPQDEVAIYQPKGALLRKGIIQEMPPGYVPVTDIKPKSKAAKRNERKKEKKQQATKVIASNEDASQGPDTVEEAQLHYQMNMLSVSEAAIIAPSPSSVESPTTPPDVGQDLDKKIRALKKKIRLTEPLEKVERDNLNTEQVAKLGKLDSWCQELKELEDRKIALTS